MKRYLTASLFVVFFNPIQIAKADWNYSKKNDAMRDFESSFAQITSQNQVDFDFPYNGGSNLQIVFRKKNGKLDAAYFIISKGQFVCGLDGCQGSIRFDSKGKAGTVENISLSPPADYSSDFVFAADEKWFLKKIKTADSLIIELPFYQASNQQFKFQVKGLKF